MKKYVLFVLFIITLVIFSSMLFGSSFAKYLSEFSGDGRVGVAMPIVIDSFSEINIPLSEMVPGDTYTYDFYVSNQEVSTSSLNQVLINYYFVISGSDNLPVIFTISEEGSNTNILDTNGQSEIYTLGFDNPEYDVYTLKASWDASYNDEEWKNLIDEITLRVYAYQALSDGE